MSDNISAEWLTDASGRQYREVNECGYTVREYRPTISTSCGTLYADEAAEITKKVKAEEAKHIEEQRNCKQAELRQCPVKAGRNMFNSNCDNKCVLYQSDGCLLAGTTASRDTKDAYCPLLGRNCSATCALYNNGCTLTEKLKSIKGE